MSRGAGRRFVAGSADRRPSAPSDAPAGADPPGCCYWAASLAEPFIAAAVGAKRQGGSVIRLARGGERRAVAAFPPRRRDISSYDRPISKQSGEIGHVVAM